MANVKKKAKKSPDMKKMIKEAKKIAMQRKATKMAKQMVKSQAQKNAEQSNIGQKNFVTQKEVNVYRSPQNGEVMASPNYQFIRMLQ